MLKQLRKKETQKKIFWILAIIIIPAFIFWGSSDLTRNRGKTPDHAGKIFGKKINIKEYNNAYISVRNQAMMQLGDNFKKLEKFLGLGNQAWDRLILLYETNKKKIKISDFQIMEEIEKIPLFQKNGNFNKELYSRTIQYSGITERDFEENLRDSLKIKKLYDEITSNIILSEQDLESEYKKENEQIKVEYISFLPEQYAQETTTSDEEIGNYFNDKKQDFLRPISVNVEYLGIDYPEKIDRGTKEEAMSRIKNIKDKIIISSDFEKIAKEEALTIKETGLFSPDEPIPQLGWSENFSNTVFSLSQNEISPVIETPKGLYILRLKEKKESYIPELSEVKQEIINTLTLNKNRVLAKQKAEDSLKQIKENQKHSPKVKLSELAKPLGLSAKETPLFKRDGYIEGIGLIKEFSETAFNIKEDEVSSVVEAENAYYILKITQFMAIDKNKFNEEKENFGKKTLEAKKEQAFMDFLNKLRTNAKLTSYISY